MPIVKFVLVKEYSVKFVYLLNVPSAATAGAALLKPNSLGGGDSDRRGLCTST